MLPLLNSAKKKPKKKQREKLKKRPIKKQQRKLPEKLRVLAKGKMKKNQLLHLQLQPHLKQTQKEVLKFPKKKDLLVAVRVY